MLRPLITCLFGSFLIGLSFLALFNAPSIIIKHIYEKLKLKEGSQALKIWEDVPLPIYNRFYFFNVTNGNAIEKEGAKPIIKEIGPFTYRVHLKKNVINYNSNGTISYREKKVWTFDKNLSIDDDAIMITTLNAPLAITLTLIQRANAAIRVLVTLALDAATEGFFIKRTVRQLLFEGYPDILTAFGPMVNPEIPSNNGHFGFMYPRNNSDDGIYTVFSGVDNIERLNLIDKFNGHDALKYWAAPQCNNIKGATNGQLRPPIKGGESVVKMFLSDICRVLQLKYEGNHQNAQGLMANRFVLDSNTFKNSIDYTPNSCYISKLPYSDNNSNAEIIQDKKGVFPSGVFDLSNCKYGIPLVVSQPHFLNGDQYYQEIVEGLKPDPNIHSFWIDIDPFTGTTVNLSARLQLNVAISKSSGVFRYRNIPEIVFPIFWQEYHFQSTQELAKNLLNSLVIPQLISSIAFYSLFSAGLTFFVISILFYFIPLIKGYCMKGNTKSLSSRSNMIGKIDGEDINEILDRRNNSSTFIGIDNPILVMP